MSSFQDTQVEEKKKFNRRRKPTGNGGRRRPGVAKEDGAAPAEKSERPERPARAPRVRAERPPAVPFPSELIDKSTTGVVTAIIRRGRLKFGFINLGNDEKANDVARVYFTFENVADADVILRRGYPVEFVTKLDDKQRTSAYDIKLTEAGKGVAAQREIELTQKRAERAAADPTLAAEQATRAPRAPRVFREDRIVSLRVTADGHADAKTLDLNLTHSVGKLKNTIATAFDAPITLNIYHVTAENPEGVFLTRTILNNLVAGDSIHLGEPREKA